MFSIAINNSHDNGCGHDKADQDKHQNTIMDFPRLLKTDNIHNTDILIFLTPNRHLVIRL
jgi:hypothetical protein